MTASEKPTGLGWYADRYPIIQDPGWQENPGMGFGQVRFFFEQELTKDECPFSGRKWRLGIVVYPSHHAYCWQLIHPGGATGGSLKVPDGASPSELYALAKAETLSYLRSIEQSND
ncbi:MAG: hypothetical protein ACRCT2_13900 [Plesiomonas shigelloides]